jgi:hypothetical protein
MTRINLKMNISLDLMNEGAAHNLFANTSLALAWDGSIP